jgi:hypothetical protein
VALAELDTGQDSEVGKGVAAAVDLQQVCSDVERSTQEATLGAHMAAVVLR